MGELATRTPPCLPEGQAARPRSQDCRVSSAPVRDMRLPSVLVSVLVGGTILYVARAALMPRALAVLLTFLLGPIVGFLERRRLGRVLPVLVVVVLMFVVLGGITWALARQFVSLSGEIPRYRENLKQKGRRRARGGHRRRPPAGSERREGRHRGASEGGARPHAG